MERIAKLMADWRVVVGAICGLPLAGFTISMVLWGQPAKASVVAGQGETIGRHGEALSGLHEDVLDIKDTIKDVRDMQKQMLNLMLEQHRK